ncbi:MAG: hypothetical protein H6741_25840 [Alphaproteobacteria bacterium]|nr:hypothetical protein [Alphaproteobacteria bacterium]
MGALAVAAAELSEAFGADLPMDLGRRPSARAGAPFAAKRVLQPWFGVEPVPVDGGRPRSSPSGTAASSGSTRAPTAPWSARSSSQAAGQLRAGRGNARQPGTHAFNQLDDWLVNRQHRTDLQAGDLVVAARVTLAPR